MKSVLLIGNYFSPGATSIFVWKSLQYLGYSVDMWDPLVSPKSPRPNKEYDICLVWSNIIPNHNLIKAKKKILFYLDDTTYYHFKPEMQLENVKKGFDQFYTCHLTKGYEDKWIPVGCEPGVHKPSKKISFEIDVIFIGTLRDERRKKFVYSLMDAFRKENIVFRVAGNNWSVPEWIGSPVYFRDLNASCNQSKILLNIHYNTAPSTKIHEYAAAGGGLQISDDKEAVLKCYPGIPVYSDVEDCIRLVKYYLSHEKERKEKVKYLLHLSKNFTYDKQIKELMRRIEE